MTEYKQKVEPSRTATKDNQGEESPDSREAWLARIEEYKSTRKWLKKKERLKTPISEQVVDRFIDLCKGHLQNDIAKRLGVDPAYISRILKKTQKPGRELLQKAIKEFGLDAEQFWGGPPPHGYRKRITNRQRVPVAGQSGLLQAQF